MFWLVAQRLNLFRDGAKIMHIAPERWVVLRTDVTRKCEYRAFDIDPERYEGGLHIPVERLNLCKDLPTLPDDHFDVIVHHHVLEHVPCEVPPVLNELKRIMKPGGTMAFSIPIRSGRNTEQDLNPDLTPVERKLRFGNPSHMRVFGTNDVLGILTKGLGEGVRLDAGHVFSKDEVEASGVPERAAKDLSSSSIILYVKPSSIDSKPSLM